MIARVRDGRYVMRTHNTHAERALKKLPRGAGLRVIAGALKGRRLAVPDWEGVRPTSDRMRETLFDVLGPAVGGSRVLDGFAGTGAIGIEALSRGAAHVTFVDVHTRALDLIAENLTRCGVLGGYTIVRAELGAAGPAAFAAAVFDLIVIDPPYDFDPSAALAALAPSLVDGGTLVLEHARRRPASTAVDRLLHTRTLTAGDTALSFYRAIQPASDAVEAVQG
jgi:16S rRNA (guanine966-N2)-methyltransferase